MFLDGTSPMSPSTKDGVLIILTLVARPAGHNARSHPCHQFPTTKPRIFSMAGRWTSVCGLFTMQYFLIRAISAIGEDVGSTTRE